MTHALTLTMRTFEDTDEDAVVELLNLALKGGPAGEQTAEFFRWKHLENPFGRSLLLLAEAEGRLVGLRAFMRWRFLSAGRVLEAVRAVDTATHPDFQGRGVFSQLTRHALTMLERTDFVYNTPNEKSLPGYLKMGWQPVGKVSVGVRVLRPLRFLRGIRSAKSTDGAWTLAAKGDVASDVLPSLSGLGPLLDQFCQQTRRDTLRTDLSLDYLQWRYGATPGLHYRTVLREEGGELKGIGIFRLRRRGILVESTVSELIVPPGDSGTAYHLLRAIVMAAQADHVTCSFTSRGAAGRKFLRAGFVLSVDGPMLIVKSLRDQLVPDPARLESWNASIGDLEVF